LEEYDYGARMYDPQIGRWHAIDPLSEVYDHLSPYQTCANNPVINRDEDGRFFGTILGAIIGGAIGGINAAIHHRNVWKGMGKGALSGAAAGAIVDITIATAGTGTVALVAAGALSGAAGNAVDQGLNIADGSQKKFNLVSFGVSIGVGGVLGYGGAKVGAWITKALTAGSTLTAVGSEESGQVIAGELENLGLNETGALNAEEAIEEAQSGEVTQTDPTQQPATSQQPAELPTAEPTLTQERLDHIIERHWSGSSAKGAGKFSPGTTGKSLKEMILQAVKSGKYRPNTRNRPGTIAEFDFGRVIGVNSSGDATSNLRVIVSPNGTVTSAFPY